VKVPYTVLATRGVYPIIIDATVLEYIRVVVSIGICYPRRARVCII